MRKEVIEKIAALMTAAFGLVAALAWNSTIQEIFKAIFGEVVGIWPMLTYAVVVTVLAVIAIVIVGRAADKASKLELKKSKEAEKKK